MNIIQSAFPRLSFGNIQAQKPVQKTAQEYAVQKPDSFEPKFSGLTDEKYSVTLRWRKYVDADVVSAVYRNLSLQDMILTSQNDNSALQLNLDAVAHNSYPLTTESALADTFHLLSRPVDVIVKTISSGFGLKAMQSATGKRLLHDGAYVSMGVNIGGFGRARNDEIQIRKELKNEYVRELEQVLMDRVGVSREEAFEAITSNRRFSALEALYYGENGLADGILTGYDQVVTRDDLMAYVKKPGRFKSEEALEAFLRFPQNISKIPTRDLATFSSETAGIVANEEQERPGLYKSIKGLIDEAEAEKKKKMQEAQANAEQAKLAHQAKQELQTVENLIKKHGIKSGEAEAAKEILNSLKVLSGAEDAKITEEEKPLTMYQQAPDGKILISQASKLPLNITLDPSKIVPSRAELINLPENRSYLQDDAIYFNAGFDDVSAEQIINGLLMLDAKKNTQENPSNIKMVVNSPGGAVIAGNDITSTIRRLKTPVDMVVNGMAASCGAWLIASVTGNRFMTPGAKIMIHDALNQYSDGDAKELNESIDGLHHMTDSFVKQVADRVGRPFKDTYNDFKQDIWFNPLEAMVYGKNGLVDGILVQDKVITREQVFDYLLNYVGGDQKALDKLINDQILSMREGKREWRPHKHDENNPFENAYKVIMELAKEALPINEIEQFKHSVTPKDTSMDAITVKVLPGM